MLKALFILRIVKILSRLFCHMGKRICEKAKVNLKVYDVTDGKKVITIHILASRSEGNQAIKFGPLTEYSMRNIFLKKSFTKCGRQARPRPKFENTSGSTV